MRVWNKTTTERAAMIVGWLKDRPHGGTAKEAHNATASGITHQTTQELMKRMTEAGMIRAVGEGSRLRYATPDHEQTTAAYRAMLMAQSLRANMRRKKAKRLELAAQRSETEPYGGDEIRHIIVREWEPARKPGPCSVFEWAGA